MFQAAETKPAASAGRGKVGRNVTDPDLRSQHHRVGIWATWGALQTSHVTGLRFRTRIFGVTKSLSWRTTAMKSNKASAVLAVLMYSQGLLGFAALAAVLLKEPEPAGGKKGSISISVVDGAIKTARVAG